MSGISINIDGVWKDIESSSSSTPSLKAAMLSGKKTGSSTNITSYTITPTYTGIVIWICFLGSGSSSYITNVSIKNATAGRAISLETRFASGYTNFFINLGIS